MIESITVGVQLFLLILIIYQFWEINKLRSTIIAMYDVVKQQSSCMADMNKNTERVSSSVCQLEKINGLLRKRIGELID